MFGLDVMRALAITLVMIVHSDIMLQEHWPRFPWLPFVDGVDLFFVLSGFLVGGILLRYIASPTLGPRSLLDFWQRRWLRTLPNYYLFLMINIVLLYFGLTRGLFSHSVIYYFAFLQNLYVPIGTFFWESWSLVVEEWFYLLFPVLLFVSMQLLKLRAHGAFLIVTGLFVLIPAAVRLIMASANDDPLRSFGTIHILVITRLDTIGFGVLAALIHHAFPGPWYRARRPMFALGALGTIAAAHFYGPDHLWYSTTWYFTLGAIAIMLLLPLFSTWRTVPQWGRPVVFLSRISYALYLVHVPFRDLYVRFYPGTSLPVAIALFVGYWAITITLAWMVYTGYEKYFMGLRDRLGARLGAATVSPSS